MSCYFLEDSRRIVGEVTYIDEVEAKILLVGEIINNVFNAFIYLFNAFINIMFCKEYYFIFCY
jgi:hypothetical protein